MYGFKNASFFDNTNLELLRKYRSKFKDMDKVLQFQGVVKLVTHFESRKRDELWSYVGRKYMPSVEVGKTGMDRERSKGVFSAQR